MDHGVVVSVVDLCCQCFSGSIPVELVGLFYCH